MDLVETLRRTLTDFSAIRLAVLFGSVARGSDSARSDVDLGVLLEEDDPSQLWPIDVAVAGAVRRTVDLVDLNRTPPLLRFEIGREGRPLVEREEGEWTRFKVRAMQDWWDWAPYARMFHALAAKRLREEARLGQD